MCQPLAESVMRRLWGDLGDQAGLVGCIGNGGMLALRVYKSGTTDAV
jgi:hypothetical protein